MKPPFSAHKNDSLTNLWPVVGLCASVLIPSTGQIQKYLGVVGIFAYLLIGSVILIVSIKRIVIISSLIEKQTFLWTFVTFFLLVVIFATVYPIADSGIVSGGSDNDDDLNKTTLRLLQGLYPYYDKTYLGNPLGTLPGAALLAIPFVLLGNSSYSNIFWLFVFFKIVKFYLKNGFLALLLFWVILLFSPVVLQCGYRDTGYIKYRRHR